MVKRPDYNHICLAMVHTRKKGHNAFAIHKAIRKQASITKMLLTGIFGIFSQKLTQLVSQIQEDENNYNDDNNTNNRNNTYRQVTKIKNKFRRHLTDSPNILDDDNNEPTKIYVDTNYKHYNTTIRRNQKGLQLRTMESTKRQKTKTTFTWKKIYQRIF